MFNYIDLRNRIISGIIYTFIIIYSIFKDGMLFHLIMMILSILCFLEFLTFSKVDKNIIKWSLLFFIISLCCEFYFLIKGKKIIINLIFFPISCFIKNIFDKKKPLEIINECSKIFLGWIYIGIPFFIARYFYYFYEGRNIMMGFFILLWINDSLSYLIGKKWGKLKLVSSNISSNKTIEGFLGGMFFSLIFGIFFSFFYQNYIWLLISLIVSIFGTIGDIIESIIKRAYNVKDSSRLFPGHGGFLDRLDSFIFTIPIIAGLFY